MNSILITDSITQTTTLDGGEGDDHISGGLQTDVIFAGVGNDTVFGRDVDYWIDGDPFDSVPGSIFLDVATGGLAGTINVFDEIVEPDPLLYNDNIWGGEGNDVIRGRMGNDWIRGEGGNDHLESNSCRINVLIGEEGWDGILGGRGTDNIDAKGGDDVAVGGSNNDTIRLGDGDNWGFGDVVNELDEIADDVVAILSSVDATATRDLTKTASKVVMVKTSSWLA